MQQTRGPLVREDSETIAHLHGFRRIPFVQQLIAGAGSGPMPNPDPGITWLIDRAVFAFDIPPAGTTSVDSTGGAGSVTNPAANAVIATTPALAAGTYKVMTNSFQSGVADLLLTNMRLTVSGVAVPGGTLLSTGAEAVATFDQITVTAGQVIEIRSIAAVAVGNIENAQLTVTRLVTAATAVVTWGISDPAGGIAAWGIIGEGSVQTPRRSIIDGNVLSVVTNRDILVATVTGAAPATVVTGALWVRELQYERFNWNDGRSDHTGIGGSDQDFAGLGFTPEDLQAALHTVQDSLQHPLTGRPVAPGPSPMPGYLGPLDGSEHGGGGS